MRLRRRTSRRQKRDRSRDVRVRATPKSSDHHHSICLAGTSPDRSTRPTDPTEQARWRQPNPQAHRRRSGHLSQGSRCRPCCSQRAGYERSSKSCVTVHRQQRTLPARQPPARPHSPGRRGRCTDSGLPRVSGATGWRCPHVDTSHSHFDAVSVDVTGFIWTFCHFDDVSVEGWSLVDFLDRKHCTGHRCTCDPALAAPCFDR